MVYVINNNDESGLQQFIGNMRGASFISQVTLENGTLSIRYVESFQEFLRLNPTSRLTQYDYDTYFDTGWAVDKIRTLESVRALRSFPEVARVHVVVPYRGKEYSVTVDRRDIEAAYGKQILDPSDIDSWRKRFADPIGYNRKEREAFVDHYGNGPAHRVPREWN